MSERETCWLVVENGEEFWGGNRTVPAITEAKRYIASEARVVAETLNAVFGGYDWQAVQHTFDPPKTPGQRFYEALYSARDSAMPPWGMIRTANQSWYDAAAVAFLAGEPKAESVAEAVLREREACVRIVERIDMWRDCYPLAGADAAKKAIIRAICGLGKTAENAASTDAQRLQDQSVTNQQGRR